ncbi:MAG: hypothetical protein NTW03_12970, partial [Verrucomicrobia bacterium]|nr:hypothetical protein [Verrucomicrobiota bacterium]
SLSFLPPGQQLAAGASIGVNENRLHGQVALYMRIMWQRHPGHKKNVSKGHLAEDTKSVRPS